MLDVAIEHRLGSFTLDIRFTTGSGLTALFGRSGAGKTSIVNAIAGLIRPQRGHIAVDGAVLLDTARGRLCAGPSPAARLCLSGRPPIPASDGAPEPAVRSVVCAAPRQPRSGRARRGCRTARDRATARPAAGAVVRRRKAARRDRPCAVGAAAPVADGRAAGLARQRPQGRDPALSRATARPQQGAVCLCQPCRRRGRAARHDNRAGGRWASAGGRARGRDHGPGRAISARRRV